MSERAHHPAPPPPRMPFGLKALVGLMMLQMLVQMGLVFLILTNPYPELVDTSSASTLELIVLLVQVPWTLAVVIGVWTRRRWVWYWMMLLFAYGMANGLRSYFWGDPDYLSMFLNVLMVLYLNQREVQQLFLHTTAEEPKTS